jgi:site-specific recombinase XerD
VITALFPRKLICKKMTCVTSRRQKGELMPDETLGEAAQVFLLRYRKDTTRLAYQTDLNHLTNFIAPGVMLRSITGFDMDRTMGSFLKIETIQSVHTINKFIKSLHTFFNWAQKRGLIDNASALKPDYLPVPENSVLERTMPNDHYNRLVSFYSALAATYPLKYQRALALVLFMGDTGTRREGLARLRWSDISFAENEATTLEKGDKSHHRPFGQATSSVLKQWQLIQKVGDEISPFHAHVFSEHGQDMTGPAVAQYFRRRCIEANVHSSGANGYGPHSVRHNLGFRLQDAKVPDNLAAAVMGHDVQTYRKHYAATDHTRVKEAALEVAFRFSDLPKPSEKVLRLDTGTETLK